MGGSYFLLGSNLENKEFFWKNGKTEKRPFFQVDMAGLGKYHTGGFGRIGVYRDKIGLRVDRVSKGKDIGGTRLSLQVLEENGLASKLLHGLGIGTGERVEINPPWA